ncbi:prolipoprotein diacylglyceryl transferase [bacterium]|nr:prolipoprotein diacylglyceryl transferase [bacterium]
MHPIIFKIGPFALHSYGLMLALAFGFGIWIASRRAPNRGLEGKTVMDVSVAALLFGLAGGRIAYVFTHSDEFQGRWLDVISPIQKDGTIGIAGLVLLGGVVAGFGGAWWMSRKREARFLTLTDVLIPSLALGIAFGRVGCFLNGCCFGHACSVPWGVVFPESSLAGSVYPHQHIHPTQIYETLAMLCLFAFLLWFDRKPRAEGVVTGVFLVLYGVWRYYVEGLRWYEEGMILSRIGDHLLTFSRVISLAMIVAGIYLLMRKPLEATHDADQL